MGSAQDKYVDEIVLGNLPGPLPRKFGLPSFPKVYYPGDGQNFLFWQVIKES